MSANDPIIYENGVIQPSGRDFIVGKVMGIISMVLGITGLCFFWAFYIGPICSVPGLVLAIVSSKNGEKKFSRIGKITSLVGLILSVLTFAALVVVIMMTGFSGI